jgi:hypothetical protein
MLILCIREEWSDEVARTGSRIIGRPAGRRGGISAHGTSQVITAMKVVTRDRDWKAKMEGSHVRRTGKEPWGEKQI